MRIAIVGGTGTQGMAAALTARARFGAQNVFVCSRSAARAKAAAAQLGVKSEVVDVSNAASLLGILSRGDIVLNVAAPYFAFGAKVAQAAIETGAHYIDICDDWEATESILELDGAAASAGVRIITGVGSAPGLNNTLAMKAIAALDEVQNIVTAWSLNPDTSGAKPRSLIPLLHLLHCAVGPIRTLRNAQPHLEEPLQPHTFHHPWRGSMTGYTIGSPESATLHRGLDGVRSNVSLLLASQSDADQLRLLSLLVRNGELSMEDAAGLLAAAPDRSGLSATPYPALVGWASGKKAGRSAVAACEPEWLSNPPYQLAGMTLAHVAEAMANGNLGAAGARSIEHAMDADDYADLVSKALGGQRLSLALELRWTPEPEIS